MEVISPYLSAGGVGAELGTFRGNFIDHFLATKPELLYVVDPWYRIGAAWGEWATGERSTLNAFRTILDTFEQEINAGTLVPVVEFSTNFLQSMPDQSLDYVYMDSGQSYKRKKREMSLCCRKVKTSGYIIGNDYVDDPQDKHYGVCKAVQELQTEDRIELLVSGTKRQFVAKPRVRRQSGETRRC